MGAYDNGKAIDEGMNRFRNVALHEYFVATLRNFCSDLFQSADNEAKYEHMTGNTFTSYACGIYVDGVLVDILASSDYKKAPVRMKLRKGEVFPAGSIRYDDEEQHKSFKADIDTDGGLGRDTSIKFLRQYMPKVRKGYEVVMCTGTEYSTFLEKKRRLNVLTNTYLFSESLFFKNLKRMN